MRLIVCGTAPRKLTGSPGWTDDGLLRRTLDQAKTWAADGELTILEGEAQGADLMARRWAEDNGVPVEAFHANWQLYGRRAGPLRNDAMLADSPDHVVAFSLHWPPVGGTGDVCWKAYLGGVPVDVVTPDGQIRRYAGELAR